MISTLMFNTNLLDKIYHIICNLHCEIGLHSDSGYTHGTSWILHGDFNLLATSSGYQVTLVETLQVHTVISTSWLHLLDTREHLWYFLWVHSDINLQVTSSGN